MTIAYRLASLAKESSLSTMKYDNQIKFLVKSLYDEGIGTAYSLQYNRTEYHLQYSVIIADLDCPGTTQFILKIPHIRRRSRAARICRCTDVGY
ncbi:hypothetical protein K1T71_010451 [Dendrolimus kikuchii]|uniref:Uncharacterized protein n=1 Tax=Dendrolimus kikuchii TaxID=765133 RepID=A0ACC1CSA1_9NEOP|nr:hypothetical protein K1T71_010451 [Dendrolimus kikuchii]